MTRLRCVTLFKDLAEGVWRRPGDEWDVTDERRAEIAEAERRQGLTLVEETPGQRSAAKKASTRKTAAKRG